MRFLFLLFASVLLSFGTVVAQITPEEAAASMGRGINLGNTLEPPQEGDWGNGPAQEYYFGDYREAGFATVRIPVRWDEHTDDAPPYAVQESWMNRVEQVVDWALAADLYVIINAHHDDWIKTGYADPGLRARFDSIWVQISERFKDHSDRLFFEMINEPQGLTQEQIDDLNARVLGIIRQTNPTRIVIYSGHEWANFEQMITAAIPQDDFLMAYYHSYDPWEFAGLAEGTWGSDSHRQAMRGKIQAARQWWQDNGIPVIVSEWAAHRDADFNSRMRYYSAYVEELVDAGLPFQVWDDGGWFRIYEREDRTWPEVRDVLIGAYPDGPTGTSAEMRDGSFVAVTWTNRSDLGGSIRIERRRPSGGWAEVGRVSSVINEFLDASIDEDITYDYRVIAGSTSGEDRVGPTFRITTPAISRYPILGVPFAIPGGFEAEDYDEGGEGLTYHDADPTNTPGGYRFDGVDLQPRNGGGWQVTGIETGEWLEYTIEVATAGTYDLTAHVASTGGGGLLRASFNGQNGPVLVVPNTNSTQTTQAVTVSVNLGAGVQIFRATVLRADPFTLDRFEFALTSTGSETVPSRPELRVHPNPVAGQLTVEGAEGQTVEVSDLLGRRLEVVPNAGPRELIDLSRAASGLYLIRVSGDAGVSVRTVVRR